MLAAWRESGRSVGAFARGHGQNPQRLTWWQERLGEWEGDAKAAPASGAAFVPVISAVGAAASVVVRLPGGVVLEADSQIVPARWVATLLRELAASSER